MSVNDDYVKYLVTV